MHPLLQVLAALLLMIVVEEFTSLMIGLWGRGDGDGD